MRRILPLLFTVILVSACSPQVPADSGFAESSASSVAVVMQSSNSSELSVPSSWVESSPAAAALESIAALPVPFTSQAPHAIWGDPYQEACEEAAILMVLHYLNNTPITPDIADREILDLVAWETENGYGYDITAAQMAEVAKDKFGLNARVRTDVTIETIKEELAAGNPIIIPVAGRDLGNPYFSGEGPWYHALTIIGYRDDWLGDYFITNDPGTKRGQQYKYRTETLLNAIHDWTGVKEEIRDGRKAMVILEK